MDAEGVENIADGDAPAAAAEGGEETTTEE
jgi:hypothetical protein